MIDMKVMAKGTDAMVQRMTEMLAKTKWWGVTPLPFEFCLSEGNMAAAYYQYHFVDPAGTKGKLHIVAIWRVRNGKIAEVKELKQIEEGQIELQQYGN
jgi:SnoaL-like protein